MNLTQEELAKLESCNSEAEWDATCNEIKAARNDGAYPPNWWVKVVLTDMRARIATKWGSGVSLQIKSCRSGSVHSDDIVTEMAQFTEMIESTPQGYQRIE